MVRLDVGVRLCWRSVPGLTCVALVLALSGCEDREGKICHDADEDGYGALCLGGPDCDDADPAVHAVTPGYPDLDGDGITLELSVSLCTGGDLPEGYSQVATGADCDDGDPAVYHDLVGYADLDGDRRGVGDSVLVCSGAQLPAGFTSDEGDCDDGDPAAFQNLRGFVDGDGDGRGAGGRQTVCTGDNLPPGLVEQSGDCDDTDPARYQEVVVYPDRDGSGVGSGDGQLICMGEAIPEGFAAAGGDCDDTQVELYQELVGYRDVDGDNVGAGDAVTLCSGDTLPEGYAASNGDCDDNQPAAYREATGFFDNDGDGLGAGDPQTFCTGAALPEGVVSSGGDCDDGSAARFQMLAGHLDDDGDGRGAGPSQLVCAGEALPEGYASGDGDCDDGDPTRYQLLSGFSDGDGDGVGVGEIQSLCAGESLPDGFAAVGGDCDDGDGDAYQLLSGYSDFDRDRFGLGALQTICTGNSLPGGFADVEGDCNDRDGDAYQLLPGYQDNDGDGIGVGDQLLVCSGDELREGYALLVGDCDDGDGDVFVLVTGYFDGDEDGIGVGELVDVCTDGGLPADFAVVAGDCDDGDETIYQELHGYFDNDADGVGGGDAVTVCTGDALPTGMVDGGGDCSDEDFYNDKSCATCNNDDDDAFFALCDRYDVAQNGPDCDPINGKAWRVLDVYRDRDGDGATVGEAHRMCLGDELPDSFVEEASDEEDCNDYDETLFLTTDIFQDADGDTYTDGPAHTVCLGLVIPDFFTDVSAGEDCDDYDPDVFQLLDGFPDTDEDTFTLAGPVDVCSGDALPPGYLGAVSGELDCDDLDPFVNPGVTEDPPGDLTDHDCDGVFPLPLSFEDGIFVDGGFAGGEVATNGVAVCPESDNDPGGIDNPVNNITTGIEYAESCDPPRPVFIAATGDELGDIYCQSSTLETTVSLYGGFRDGFTRQDPATSTRVYIDERPVLLVPVGAEVSIVGLTVISSSFSCNGNGIEGADGGVEPQVIFENSGDAILRHFTFDLEESVESIIGVLNTPTGTLFAADNTIDVLEDFDGDVNGEGAPVFAYATALRNEGALTAIRNVLRGGEAVAADFGGMGLENLGSAVARANEITGGFNCCDPENVAAAVYNWPGAEAWLVGNDISGLFLDDEGECFEQNDASAGVANEGSAWIRDNDIRGGCAVETYGVYTDGSAVVTGNTVVGGEQVEGRAFGILNHGGEITIAHNPRIIGAPYVEGGGRPVFAYGIGNGAFALIGDNAIVGGLAEIAFGIGTVGAAGGPPITQVFDNDIAGSLGFGDGIGIASEGDTLVVARNAISGGASAAVDEPDDAYGIEVEESVSAVLRFNTISGASFAEDTVTGMVVDVEGSAGDVIVEYNDISAGRADFEAFALILEEVTGPGRVFVRENTITGGTALVDAAGIVFIEGVDAFIEHNTVVGGSAFFQCAGIRVEDASPSIRGNDITGCVPSTEFEPINSAGIEIEMDELPLFATIEGNHIDGGVGRCVAGIVSAGTTTITDNVITGGMGSDLAFGITAGDARCFDSNALSSTISGNVIDGGASGFVSAGLWLEEGLHVLTNNIVHGGQAEPFGCCTSTASAGVIQEPDALVFAVHNTIYGGRSVHAFDEVFGSFGFWFLGPRVIPDLPQLPVGAEGAGGDDDELVTTFLINNIIDPGEAVGGNHSASLFMQKEWLVFLSYNDLWGERMTHMLINFPWSGGDPHDDPGVFVELPQPFNACTWRGCFFAEGNISEDPLFANPAFGDFHIEEGSPVIDAGTNPTPDGVPVPRDVDWDPRPFGWFDMGADEFVPELEL